MPIAASVTASRLKTANSVAPICCGMTMSRSRHASELTSKIGASRSMLRSCSAIGPSSSSTPPVVRTSRCVVESIAPCSSCGERQIDERDGALVESIHFGILSDADDLNGNLVVAEDPAGQRIAARPVFLRCGFVDDGHLRRARSVGLRESAAAEQPGADRPEVVGSDGGVVETDLFIRRRLVALDGGGEHARSDRRNDAGPRRRRHARQLADPRQAVGIERPRARRVVPRRAEVDRSSGHAADLEPQGHVEGRHQAAEEQPGADRRAPALSAT